MKKNFFLLITGLVLITTRLNADIDFGDVGSEKIAEPEKEEQSGPFTFEVEGDYVGSARIKKCCHQHHLKFATWEAEASMVFYYDPCIQEGANVALDYQRTYLDWEYNPYFSEKNFDTISITFAGFTKRVQDWLWQAQVAINFDNIPHWTIQDYMYYDLLLWGRYNLCQNIGFHIGFLAQTGMKIDRVYPIIGIDWTYDCHWKFNLVYPVNISAIYTLNRKWTIALAARFLDQRHRVSKDQYLSEGLWHYMTSGAELGVNFTPYKSLTANLHAGYNFGGHIYIAERHYHHRQRYKIGSAPYAGAQVTVTF